MSMLLTVLMIYISKLLGFFTRLLYIFKFKNCHERERERENVNARLYEIRKIDYIIFSFFEISKFSKFKDFHVRINALFLNH